MSTLSLEAEIPKIERVVPPVGDRRDSDKRRRPFPEFPGEEPEPETPPKDEAPREPGPTTDEDEHTIDLLVLGLLLPTGHSLPGGDLILRVH